MKYLVSDYDLLRSVTLRGDRSISFSITRHEFTLNHGNLIPPACMMHALRGLASGGYITVEAPHGVINGTDPVVCLTEKGRPWKVLQLITVKVLSGEISAERADGALHVFRTDSTVLSFSMKNAFTFCHNCVLRSAAACPHLLTEEHFEKVSALHRRVLPHVQKRYL